MNTVPARVMAGDFTGSNNPPAEDAIELRVDQLVAAVDMWAKTVPEIGDADNAKRCVDLLDQLTAEEKATSAARAEELKPLNEAVATARAKWQPLLDRLGACIKIIKPKLIAWNGKEKARLAAAKAEKEVIAQRAIEEAKRKAEAVTLAASQGNAVEAQLEAQRAAEKADAAIEETLKAPGAPVLKGDFSVRARAVRLVWSAEITDYREALTFFADHPKIREALQQIADAMAREKKAELAVPGLKAVSRETM